MDLAVSALRRDVLTRYGTEQFIHGVRVPDWLIVDGADASSEAVLGLAAYVRAGGDPSARIALGQLARGISAMSAGTTTAWPYRALLPWALSRSDWHAWGANMPAALAAAAQALGEKSLLATAVDDTAGFTAQLLTSTGPDNEWLPAPTDSSQIAYGADARVQGPLAVGAATNRPGIRQLAGIAAGWFFGQNAAGVPVYDPSSGVTRDGIAGDGKVNLNSGAESTIHGLLTMQVLDANPDLAALATAAASIRGRDGLTVLEAESGSLYGDSTIVTPPSAWTGESKFSGGTYVAAGPGSTIRWALPASIQPRLVQPVARAGARFVSPQHRARRPVDAGDRAVRCGRPAGQCPVTDRVAADRAAPPGRPNRSNGDAPNFRRQRERRRAAGHAGGRDAQRAGCRSRRRAAHLQVAHQRTPGGAPRWLGNRGQLRLRPVGQIAEPLGHHGQQPDGVRRVWWIHRADSLNWPWQFPAGRVGMRDQSSPWFALMMPAGSWAARTARSRASTSGG